MYCFLITGLIVRISFKFLVVHQICEYSAVKCFDIIVFSVGRQSKLLEINFLFWWLTFIIIFDRNFYSFEQFLKMWGISGHKLVMIIRGLLFILFYLFTIFSIILISEIFVKKCRVKWTFKWIFSVSLF